MRFLLIIIAVLNPAIKSFSQKRLSTGNPVPEIFLSPVFGDSIRTSSLKGKKVLFMFNRYVSCPLCNLRAHEIFSVYDTLRKFNLVVVSIYESPKEQLTEFTKQEDIPFVMVADPEEKLYKLFKVQKSWWKSFTGLFREFGKKRSKGKKLFKGKYERDGSINRIGADFLVDENGIIQVAYYGKFVGDHLPVEDIVKWAKK